MSARLNRNGKAQLSLPLFALFAGLVLGLPSAGLAVVGSNIGGARSLESLSFQSLGLDVFTPASVDPALAARVADKARARGIRFTPARNASIGGPTAGERTVTVAVRVDGEDAKAINVRTAIEGTPGRGTGLAALQASRFQLGTARGYKSFARPVELPSSVRRMAMPDLAEFEPSKPNADDKPSRLQPRIELEDRAIAGRSPNTLDAVASQTVGVGGSFRLSPNLDVTAGVRYSQERERLDPLTNSVQDSQAVYVGTQIKF